MENLVIYYANDNHLSIILSEYLKNKNKERCEIITFFQEGIEKEIRTIKEKTKNNMLDEINFRENVGSQNFKINVENKEKEIIIIIRGNKEYINEIYNQIMENNKFKEYNKIKIIKCFNIQKQENEIKENIKENKKIITTSGECDIF